MLYKIIVTDGRTVYLSLKRRTIIWLSLHRACVSELPTFDHVSLLKTSSRSVVRRGELYHLNYRFKKVHDTASDVQINIQTLFRRLQSVCWSGITAR